MRSWSLIGLIAGTVLSIAAAGAARAMLFRLKLVDPLALTLAVGVLTMIAAVASALPAARATAVEPSRRRSGRRGKRHLVPNRRASNPALGAIPGGSPPIRK